MGDLTKYPVEVWVLPQNIFFHHLYIIAIIPKVGSGGQVTKAIFIILNSGKAAIAIFKIVQKDLILGEISTDMIFHPYIMIELSRPLPDETSFPPDIQVASFSISSCNYPGSTFFPVITKNGETIF